MTHGWLGFGANGAGASAYASPRPARRAHWSPRRCQGRVLDRTRNHGWRTHALADARVSASEATDRGHLLTTEDEQQRRCVTDQASPCG